MVYFLIFLLRIVPAVVTGSSSLDSCLPLACSHSFVFENFLIPGIEDHPDLALNQPFLHGALVSFIGGNFRSQNLGVACAYFYWDVVASKRSPEQSRTKK